MNNREIEKNLTVLNTQMILLKAQISALQETFFAYLASEHNDQHPKFSENVRAENADIFGEKISEFFERLPAHDAMAENVRREIFRQMEILKNDIDDLEDYLGQE